MTRAELFELVRLLGKLEVELEAEEEARACPTEARRLNNMRDFYLPRVPENFYYDPKVFRKLLGIR